MKEYIKINIASPQKVLEWTERALPDGKLLGEITKSTRLKRGFNKLFLVAQTFKIKTKFL